MTVEQVPGHYDYRDPPVPLDEMQRADERSRIGSDMGAGESMAGDVMAPDSTGTAVPGAGFWAIITDVDGEVYNSGSLYSFIEAGTEPDGLTVIDRLEMGRFGVLDALELTGNFNVPDGAVVWMTPTVQRDYSSSGAGYGFVYGVPSTVEGDVTYEGDVTFEGDVIYTSTSTLTLQGSPVGITTSTTVTVATGQTFTIAAAGTGAFTVSAPMTVSGSSFTISAPVTASGSSFTISTPGVRLTPAALTLSNGGQALALSSLTRSLMRITGPSAAWSITSVSGSPVDGDTFYFLNASGQTGTLTGSSFSLVGGYDKVIPDGMAFSITYDGTSSKWRVGTEGGVTGKIVGVSPVANGTSGRILYDNAGTLGEKAVTGTGDVVLSTSPTLVTPALGTPASGTLTNCTGLPTAGLVDGSVTYAKVQDVSAASKLLGRGDSGSGDVQEITLGSGLAMSGTTLSASGGSVSQYEHIMAGSYTVTGSWAVVNDGSNNLSVDLPSAGTYLLWAQVQVEVPGSDDVSLKLYDSTNSSDTTGVVLTQNDNTDLIRVTVPLFACHTAAGAVTIQVRAMYNTGGGGAVVRSFSTGNSKVGYLKIA